MRYLFLAGEPSGDQHAAGVIRALKALDPEAEFWAMGGDSMAEAGAKISVHTRELGFMGFSQLLRKAAVIRRTFAKVRRDILTFKPDMIVPVDFGGFNLRIIRWASKKGFRSVYYIPPKTWAWMPGRSRKLANNCEKVICILPFEPDFLKTYGVMAEFAGNPVLDYVSRMHGENANQPGIRYPGKEIIALLPGSRDQEIKAILPVMGSVVSAHPDYRFVIAACEPFTDEYYLNLLPDKDVSIIRGKTLEILQSASAALVASGTATLEAGLIGVPQVVCYKTSAVSYLIARMLIRVKHISLVNLILGRECVKELIQSKFTSENLNIALRDILDNESSRLEILSGYRELRQKLGEQDAYARAAAILCAAAGRS